MARSFRFRNLLRPPRAHGAAHMPRGKARAAVLRLTTLEDRCTPVSVGNVFANTPEVNQIIRTPTNTTQGQGFTQSETSTLTFGDTVLVSFTDTRPWNPPTSNTKIGFARSDNGGATFTEMGNLLGNNARGDSVWARDTATGRVYLLTVWAPGTGFALFRSDNGGESFLMNDPVHIMQSVLVPDKPWIAVDNFPSSGEGNVYVVGRDFHDEQGNNGGIYLARSMDGGANFDSPVQVVAAPTLSDVQGANVVVLPNHHVLVFYYDYTSTPKTIKVKVSTDLGASFGPPATVTDINSHDFNGGLGLGFDTNAFPQVAVNPSNGNLYVTYNDYPTYPVGTDKADIFFTMSSDGGATWSASQRVNTDIGTNDQWQPSIQVTPDGTHLAVGWYDRRLDPYIDFYHQGNRLIDYFARTATISGSTVTFQPDGQDLRVSNQSFARVFNRDPFSRPGYMGDYDGAVGAATNTQFHFSWGDNRQGGPDVATARISVNATAPEVVNTPLHQNGNGAYDFLDFVFNQDMDPTTLAAADVVSFTRDGGDIRDQIDFKVNPPVFLPDLRTLRIWFVTPLTQPGAYALRVGPYIANGAGAQMDDDLNGVSVQGRDTAIATFYVAGVLTQTLVNSGQLQRSRVTSVSVYFPGKVTFFDANGVPTLPSDAFTLIRLSTSEAVSFTVTPVYVYDGTAVNGQLVVTGTLVVLGGFTGTATESGSIADGRYTLTARANKIRSNDSQLGADYVLTSAGRTGVFRLYGDATGDARVDVADFGLFSSTYLLSESDPYFLGYFDFNNDGHIDSADFAEFNARYQTYLP